VRDRNAHEESLLCSSKKRTKMPIRGSKKGDMTFTVVLGRGGNVEEVGDAHFTNQGRESGIRKRKKREMVCLRDALPI